MTTTDAAIAQANELKSCPFCGGAGSVCVCVGYHGRTDAKVICDDCGSEGPLFGANDYYTTTNHSIEAIAAWNRRTPAREMDAEKGGGCNRHIDEVLREYEMENWSAADCIPVAKRYVSTMPDSQVRCLLHILATPPAQAAEAVDNVHIEAAAEAIWYGFINMAELTRDAARQIAREAFAAAFTKGPRYEK